MDCVEMYHVDREQYNWDLDELIDSASKAAASAAAIDPETNTTPPASPSPSPSASTMAPSPSPILDPRLRKRSAATQGPPPKRTKVESPSDERRRASAASAGVHPARLEPTHDHQPGDHDTFGPGISFAPCDDRTRANSIEVGTAPQASPGRPSSRSRSGSATTYSLDQIMGTRAGRGTKSNLQNAVRRQWDPSKDDLVYEDLVARRRQERLTNVDRYIPYTNQGAHAGCDTGRPRRAVSRSVSDIPRPINPFPFPSLPGRVQDRILALLLVQDSPITIDFTWLRPFVNGHCRVPVAADTLSSANGASFTLPVDWTTLVKDVAVMESDCSQFKSALELRGNKTRKLRGPGRGLTTGLLRVSRDVHRRAVTVFYSENTFAFPWPTAAWMQLESFLATIGSTNVRRIRSISIHVPLWHRGIHEDYVEGAILDLTTPASRLGIVQLTGRDRLLSAIRSCVQALSKAGRLENLSLELEHGINTDRWTGRYSNNRQLIGAADAEEHVVRKQEGIELLRKACRILPQRPTLTLYHPSSTAKIAQYHVSEFRSRLASVIMEANKYGWQVDQQLKGSRW